VPRRFYFLFGEPIETDPSLAADRDSCQRVYEGVKADVAGGLGYLLRMRDSDPYGDIVPRLIFEGSRNWQQQAPSFKP
jgi:hypothetical protein